MKNRLSQLVNTYLGYDLDFRVRLLNVLVTVKDIDRVAITLKEILRRLLSLALQYKTKTIMRRNK